MHKRDYFSHTVLFVVVYDLLHSHATVHYQSTENFQKSRMLLLKCRYSPGPHAGYCRKGIPGAGITGPAGGGKF
jgi:hypothetical protein